MAKFGEQPFHALGKIGAGAEIFGPGPPTHLSHGHFFRPPVDVSLFCPGGHLPDPEVTSGLPLPGPSSIWARAAPENDVVSANTSAANSNEMRLRIRFLSSLVVSHPVAPPR